MDSETAALKSYLTQVMRTNAGQGLFEILERRHVSGSLWRKDQRQQDYDIGKHDLIRDLIELEARDV